MPELPEVEAWRAGLDVLAAKPLDWGPSSSERSVHARTLQGLALDALRLRASTIESRATVYGELLVACASCHTSKQPATLAAPDARPR